MDKRHYKSFFKYYAATLSKKKGSKKEMLKPISPHFEAIYTCAGSQHAYGTGVCKQSLLRAFQLGVTYLLIIFSKLLYALLVPQITSVRTRGSLGLPVAANADRWPSCSAEPRTTSADTARPHVSPSKNKFKAERHVCF